MARPEGPGSHEPSPDGLGPTGFDPSRIAALMDDEQLILDALTDAYHRGRLDYMHYSAAFDVTAARLAAMSWHSSDSDRSGAAVETTGSTVGESAGPQDIAQGSAHDPQ